MNDSNNSLYTEILKKSHNAAVMRDIVIKGLHPFYKQIIETFVKENYENWLKKRVFILDVKYHFKDAKPNFAIFPVDELTEFILTNLQDGTEMLSDESEISNLKFKKITLDELFDKIDTSAIIKIINYRMPWNYSGEKFKDNRDPHNPDKYGKISFCLEDFNTEVLELRNKYEGHLTGGAVIKCTTKTLIDKINLLIDKANDAVKNFDDLLKYYSLKKAERNLAESCRNLIPTAIKHLQNIKEAVADITSHKIAKDSSVKYSAINLFAYNVFLVYPDAHNDKFRRFCNDNLRSYHTLAGTKVFTDTGTISRLEMLSSQINPNESICKEAKRILKELFEPMLREGVLRVLDIYDDSGEETTILDAANKKAFLEKIAQIKSHICVVTNDSDIANGIWNLNSDKENQTPRAVAVKALNKNYVIPYYNF